MSDSASQNELIAQFTGVTGVDTDRAKFFLESEGWNLDVSLLRTLCTKPLVNIFVPGFISLSNRGK